MNCYEDFKCAASDCEFGQETIWFRGQSGSFRSSGQVSLLSCGWFTFMGVGGG